MSRQVDRRLIIHSLVLTLAICSTVAMSDAGASPTTRNDKNPTNRPEIAVGWQLPWATQGQIVEVLKNTNVLKANGVTANFQPFTFGGPLNEAALAGGIDVLLTADQPAATLLSKSTDFEIVARLMYNRVSVYVPPNSPIRRVEQLRGKTVAVPFGAAAQRELIRAIKDARLDPSRDVKIINLDIVEQSALVKNASDGKWGSIDALAGFDPTPAIFQEQGLIRIIHASNVVAVVMMKKSVLSQRRTAESFLRAYAQAWGYFAANTRKVNDWYKNDAGFNFEGQRPLEISASVEPNARAGSVDELRLTFTPGDLSKMQQAADFLLENGLIQKPVEMSTHTDTTIIEAVQKKLRQESIHRIRVSSE